MPTTPPRDSKQLLLDTRSFAVEHRPTSWWCVLSSLALFIALQAAIAFVPVFALRIAASIAAGLLLVRLFVIYHDYEHGTILKKSTPAWLIFKTWGILTLNPPSIWRRSHDHHHKHNSKMFGAAIGSFPLMTVEAWADASPAERRIYRVTRHPLLFLFGYLTVFLYGMCIRSLLNNPRLHADSAAALGGHLLLIGALVSVGLDALLLHLILPGMISAAMGSYLFYAQHNFPDAYVQRSAEWDYVTAALRSSSYMKMNPVMAWVTGNIGFHHVHHLNHHIPFYRLPETMKAMPELQNPGITSLKPRDVAACFRLKLWDRDQARLVPFPPQSPPA